MNPLLKKQFESLETQIGRLREVLEKNSESQQELHGEKSDLMQEKWRTQKELTTLRRIAKDYDEVESENDRYRDERDEIRQDLAKIMDLSKALRGAQSK